MYKLTFLRLSGEKVFENQGTIPELMVFLPFFVSKSPAYSTVANSVNGKGYYVADFLDADKVPLLIVIVPIED